MTTPAMIALIKVAHHTEDYFYASDLGLRGGTLKALEERGYIEKSGKTKDYFIEVEKDLYRKVTVYEWHIINRKPPVWTRREFENTAAEILLCADLLRSECGY